MGDHDKSDDAPKKVRSTLPLTVRHQGQVAQFQKFEIDRARLYGSRHLIALDADGTECATALLTRDGQFLLTAGSTALLYVNDAGDSVERRDLLVVDAAGVALAPRRPPTAEPQELQGPVPARDLLDCVAVTVHALDPLSMPPTLSQALGAGDLFRLADDPRRTTVESASFLVSTRAGLFLIEAVPTGFDFIEPEQFALPNLSANDDDESDDDSFAFTDPFEACHGAA